MILDIYVLYLIYKVHILNKYYIGHLLWSIILNFQAEYVFSLVKYANSGILARAKSTDFASCPGHGLGLRHASGHAHGHVHGPSYAAQEGTIDRAI